MMSFGTSSICASCKSVPSTTSCEGCRKKFCSACLSTHRDELLLEFEDLVNRRNELVEIIDNHLPNSTTGVCPCFDEINRWQTEMHTNIDRIAAAARDNIRQFLSEASKNVRAEFDQISQDLQQRQKTGAYIEGDLNRIKEQLTQINDTVKRFNVRAKVDTSISKSIDWDSLLIVMPNEEHRTRTASATNVLSSPNLYNSFGHRLNDNMSTHHQQFYPAQSIPHSTAPQQSARPTPSHMTNTQPPPYNTNSQPPPYNTNSQPPLYSMNSQRPSYRTNSEPPLYNTNSQRPSYNTNSRPPPSNQNFRPRTYQCIGCKTVNTFNENGRNNCSVCRCPAPL